MIIGIDEVGRGPLAGPVVACACHLPETLKSRHEYTQLQDSKKLSAKKREALSLWLHQNAIFAIGEASVEEIDSINILQATFVAMERAVAKLDTTMPHDILIDGNKTPKSLKHAKAIIGGDGLIPEISAASIIAKVYRDKLMCDLAKQWNMYGWENNAGYGTAVHMEGIKTHGITIHHRKSFAPVRAYIAA